MVARNDDQNEAPTPEHVEWCRQLIRVTKDGAMWGIPRSGTTFRFDKPNQRLVLVIPGNDNFADFEATKAHFAVLGWAVLTQEEAANAAKKNTE
jgi:hypothetical protein